MAEDQGRTVATGGCQAEATILLADVAGSTRLYESLGNEAANRLIAASLNDAADAVRRHGGVVVKTIGDAILAYFPRPECAVRCGLEIVSLSAEGTVRLSLCCHHGVILHQEGDIFGDAVNVTAHIAGKARPGELLTTGSTVERLSASAVSAQRLDEVWLKSRSESVTLYLVTPREPAADQTSLHGAGGAQFATVVVMHRGSAHEISRNARSSLSLGRAPECDLVFDDPRVSRQHASIEAKGRHVHVRDHSRNGTILRLGDSEIPLLREDHRLIGSGTIALGGPADDPDTARVEFLCRF